jgi:recombination protein RecR
VRRCSVCNTLTEEDPCEICSDPRRDPSILCVVEEPGNLAAIEKTREFRGRYHVLWGALSPLRGIGPDEIDVAGLVSRITPEVSEVVIATNPNVEGEATALYLARRLKGSGVRVTRIAFGLPGRRRHRVRGRGDDGPLAREPARAVRRARDARPVEARRPARITSVRRTLY